MVEDLVEGEPVPELHRRTADGHQVGLEPVEQPQIVGPSGLLGLELRPNRRPVGRKIVEPLEHRRE